MQTVDIAKLRLGYPLIGISGKAGSGKDTLGSYISERYGYHHESFARPLKEALNTIFNWDMDKWNDREWKEQILPEFEVSPRSLVQTLGTEWGRKMIDPDLWVKLLGLKIKFPCVITDVRFPNEAKFIKENNGLVIKLSRESGAVLAHASEVLDFEPNVVLENTGSIQDLFDKFEAYIWGKTSFFETFPNAVKALSQMDMTPGKTICLPTPDDELGQLKINAFRHLLALERLLDPDFRGYI